METLIVTPTIYVWVEFNRRYNNYLVDAYYNVEGGIKHWVCRYPSYCLEWILGDLQQRGNFSKRPFKLGQGCDGSGDACCAALYHDFCTRQDIDPLELYRQAYQEHDGDRYCDPDYAAILQEANWQGVEYPQGWNEPELNGLLDSLDAINNRSLVQTLEETPPFLQ